jgi:hypothetical protein
MQLATAVAAQNIHACRLLESSLLSRQHANASLYYADVVAYFLLLKLIA